LFIQDHLDAGPSISTETVISILDQSRTASELCLCVNEHAEHLVPPKDHPLYQSLRKNQSLHAFSFLEIVEDDEAPPKCLQRDDHLWKEVTREATSLVTFTRLLSALKISQKSPFPAEIITQILSYSFAQSPLWNKEQLDIIIRCLRDRRTIGSVYSEVVKLDKNVLYVKCTRALARL
jgi:hypothetical protein